MAFFCEKTNVRIVAPGVSISVDPANGVALYEENEACDAAEHAAVQTLAAARMHDDEKGPSSLAIDKARAAAKSALAGHKPAPKTSAAKHDDKPEPKGGGRRPPEPKPDNS